MDGKIFGLIQLIRDHRGAVEYDWRTRFGHGLVDIAEQMSIAEAGRLGHVLLTDPSSQTHAAAHDWEYAASHQHMLLMQLFDLQHTAAAGKKVEPLPRPWPDEGTLRMIGGRHHLSNTDAIALLRANAPTR